MRIAIIGTGYVGRHCACFAEIGHQVLCVDNNLEKVKVLCAGGIRFTSPVSIARRSQRRRRSPHVLPSDCDAVAGAEVIFIAVPTPPQPDGAVDLSFIEKVAREIAGAITSYKIVVDKSTVPVNTGEKVGETIRRYCKAKVEFDVVSNPEFLREGFAIEDLMRPDRVVIGVQSPRRSRP
jgi:UDPglucose 6-dehydrogenase